MKFLALCAAIAMAAAGLAIAQSPPQLDAASRVAVVQKAAETLRNRYIFPDVAEQAAARIEAKLAAGAYADLPGPAFAQMLTKDLQDVAKDKHLRVTAPGMGPAPGPPPRDPPPRAEAGLVRADRLAGGIGYIEISGFPGPQAFKPVIEKAMTALGDSKALIVDVRRNGGGNPDSVSLLVSYFTDPAHKVHVNDFINRTANTKDFTTQSFYTSPTPVSFAGKPLYVLTSLRTFSGGEEFAYDIQALKLGTLVGETTGGGANPGGTVPLGSGVSMFVPGGRAKNPITGTNWEGVGVKPEIAAPMADALKVALERLGQTPAASSIEALSHAQLFAPRSTAKPGAEAALRRAIAELASGQPNYEWMTETMASATRQQLPNLTSTMSAMGAIQSVTFREVDFGGNDAYEVKFANGALIWSVGLDSEGRLAAALFRRPPP